MNRFDGPRLRAVLAAAAVALAVVHAVWNESTKDRFDHTFLVLLGAAALILLVQWEKLTQLKAGGLELSLGRREVVRGAVQSLSGLDLGENEELRRVLSRFDDLLPLVRGSRVLWIDDHPGVLTGERRLLRSLGVDVVAVRSSAEADAELARDNDFDLVVTDVQREGSGGRINDGVDYILALRQRADLVSRLPVVFYAAYDEGTLAAVTAPARRIPPGAAATNSVHALVDKVVPALAAARRAPVPVPAKKPPTGLEGRYG